MYHHIFQIFLFLRINKQNTTVYNTNPNILNNEDHLHLTPINMHTSELKKLFEDIASELSKRRYIDNLQELEGLEIRVDTAYGLYQAYLKQITTRVIPRHENKKKELVENYRLFNKLYANYKNNSKKFQEKEKQRIFEGFNCICSNAVDESNKEEKVGTCDQQLRCYVNKLDKENRNRIKNLRHNIHCLNECRVNSFNDYFKVISQACNRAQQITSE